MAVPVGIMISFVASGPAAQAFGWRTALLLAAAPAIVLVPMLLTLPEPKHVRKSATVSGVATLAKVPALWWFLLVN